MLSLLGEPEDVCTLWCHLAEKQPDRVEALLQQLLDFGSKRVKGWDADVAGVDREPDAARHFLAYVQHLLQTVPGLVLYFDNLESLMVGPPEDDSQPPRPEAFAEWQPPQAGGLWRAFDGWRATTASCSWSPVAAIATPTLATTACRSGR